MKSHILCRDSQRHHVYTTLVQVPNLADNEWHQSDDDSFRIKEKSITKHMPVVKRCMSTGKLVPHQKIPRTTHIFRVDQPQHLDQMLDDAPTMSRSRCYLELTLEQPQRSISELLDNIQF